MVDRAARPGDGIVRHPAAHASSSWVDSGPLVILTSLMVFTTAFLVLRYLGPQMLLWVTGGVAALILLTGISLRWIQVALLVWLVSLMGFRRQMTLVLPGLPDPSPDRALLVWVLALLLAKRLFGSRQVVSRQESAAVTPPPVAFGLLDALLVLHALYLLASCLLVNPTAYTIWERAYMMPTAAFFIGKYVLSDGRWFERTVQLLVLLNVYMGFTSIAEHFHWNALVWPRWILSTELDVNFEYAGRSHGIFQQPGVLGIFIGMILPFNVYLHLKSRGWWRWLHLVGIVICLGGLYFTYTRSTWLGAAVGLATLALLGRRIYARRIFAYGLLTVLVLGSGSLGMKQDTFLQERVGTENTITERISVLGRAIRMWQDRPLFGTGFKRYTDFRDDYAQAIEVPYFGLIKAGLGRVSSPHDIYVAILAEEGLVGAAMQLWIYILLVRAYRRVYRFRGSSTDGKRDWWLPAIGGLGACYFMGGVGFDYRYFETMNTLFYLCGGVIASWATFGVGQVRSFGVRRLDTTG
ncbi:MAG: O-antigen ligase family protein [Candidatus Krumholzibacteriia bacterium]